MFVMPGVLLTSPRMAKRRNTKATRVRKVEAKLIHMVGGGGGSVLVSSECVVGVCSEWGGKKEREREMREIKEREGKKNREKKRGKKKKKKERKKIPDV